ncbi:hypothetical protein JXE04_03085 [Patescibacteria group bacterium]|nr:hypothetical protein [Patescibacteria group bacterium]
MEKSKVWLIIGLIMIVSALVLRITSPRDRWVCDNGQWRAQGSPRTAQPTRACVDNLSIDTELQALSDILKDEPLSNSMELPDNKLVAEESNLAEKFVDSNEPKSIDNSLQLNQENISEIVPEINVGIEESFLDSNPESSFQLISPQPDELLRSPYLISGRVWVPYFYKSVLLITLQTESGEPLFSYSLDSSVIPSGSKGWFNFQVELTFDTDANDKGLLLFNKKSISQKSKIELLLSRPVYLAPSQKDV